MLNRVLILSATSGNGHLRAAEAVEKALRKNDAARQVQHLDALQYTSPMFRNMYSRTYIRLVNKAPHVLGLIYDAADKPWRGENSRLAFDRLNALPLVRMIQKAKPDVIICTHFMPAEIVSWMIGRGKINARHAVVVTDFDAHAMWLTRNYDVYFTAMEETREHLISLGLDPAKVEVTGIPIDPIFAQNKDKHAMRAKHGISQDKTVIMLSAGGFGVGRMEELLQHLSAIRHPVQILAMCGKNEKLKREIEEFSQAEHEGAAEFKAVGFTKEMDEFMSAADMIVGKPGGLTTCEALTKGLVFVIVNPIPGQEERNSDHLLEEGTAIRCNNLPALAYKIDRLLDDPPRLAQMREKTLCLAKPDAADDIVAYLARMARNEQTTVPARS
jgi:processive 1,2-diacylglycerol beta-glucosyltransferase